MTYLCTPERMEKWLAQEQKAGRIIRWKKVCDGLYITEREFHFDFDQQLYAAAGFFPWPFKD